MKKQIKYLTIWTILLSTLIHLSGLSVYAQEVNVSATNEQTQAGSTNTAEARMARRAEITNENEACVNNNIDQQANTGGNTIEGVNGQVSMQTGNIDQSLDVTTDLNSNNTQIEGFDSGSINSTNQQTGADSYNETTAFIDQNIVLNHENSLVLNNSVISDLNTGINTAEKVNGTTSILTGNIQGQTKITNDPVNINKVVISPADPNIVITGGNYSTQSNSQNIANVGFTNNIFKSENNDQVVNNSSEISMNTGFNTCHENNGDCTIRTGNIVSKLGITTTGNINDNHIGPNPTVTPTIPTPTPTVKPIGGMDVQTPENPISSLQVETEPIIEAIENPIQQLLASIVPAVAAAVEPSTNVLGALQLPMTGVGGQPQKISFQEIVFSLGVLILGMMIRQRFNPRKSVQVN